MNISFHQFLRPFFLLSILSLLLGCSKKSDDRPRRVTIKGTAEKGPFVRGSVVTLEELDSDLNLTGRSYTSATLDNKGSFSFTDIELVSSYAQISVNGHYFNEVDEILSYAPVRLNAIVDVTTSPQLTINTLTHLEERRVMYLVKKKKMAFKDAKKHALTEVYEAFFVKSSPAVNSESISLIKNDENSNILLGISAASLSNRNIGLTEFLNKVSLDLEDNGALKPDLKNEIETTFKGLNSKILSKNIVYRYKQLNTPLAEFILDGVFTVGLKGVADGVYASKNALMYNILTLLASKTQKSAELHFKLEGLYSKTISGAPQHKFYSHQLTPSDPELDSLFTSIYQNINLANVLISNAEISSDPDIQSFKYKSYPFFAYSYWLLMNNWGNTGFINSENFQDLYNKPVMIDKEKLTQILLAGLDQSIQRGNPVGTLRMIPDFARAVAARIAADNGDYSSSLRYLNEIIIGKRYFLANQSRIHTSGDETILGLDYGRYLGSIKPNGDYDLYAKGDNISIIRYTEVILLASESNLRLNNKSEAILLLNQVRLRNGKTALLPSENNVLSFLQEEVKDDLKNEGVYFAFLKRNNLAETVLGIKSYQKLLPIPQREIDLNKNIIQNQGY